MGMTIHEIAEASPAQLAALPPEELMRLQQQADENAAAASRIVNVLHATLSDRYARAISAPGTHHSEDGAVAVTVVLPKKVKWDQAELATASETIRGWGEDPADYVTTKLEVSERRFDAWPPAIRAVFEPARTVDLGKPKIELAPIEKEAA